ncbi:unnamed protein product, partial [Mesorhabditis spiculigera]
MAAIISDGIPWQNETTTTEHTLIDSSDPQDLDYLGSTEFANSTESPTELYDQNVDPVLASSMLGAVCLISVPILCLAIYVIYANKKISKDVKPFLYLENACRILILLAHAFWGIPSGLFLVPGQLFILDLLIAYTFNVSFTCVCLAQLAMSINRFFAVYFDGVYYDRQNLGNRVKLSVLIVLPMILYIPTVIPPLSVGYFEPYFFSFTFGLYLNPKEAGMFWYLFLYWYLVTISFIALIIIWIIGFFFDGLVLLKTAINHGANAIGVSAGLLGNFVRFDAFHLFLFVTFINFGVYAVFGLNQIIFLRSKNRDAAGSTVSPPKSAITGMTMIR